MNRPNKSNDPLTVAPLRRAFTLIEILVVLAVIGVLLGMGVYTFGDFGRYRILDSEVRAMANDIMVARSLADTRNRMTQWQMLWYEDPNDPGRTHYLTRILIRSDAGGEPTWRDVYPARRIDPVIRFADDVTYSTMLAGPGELSPPSASIRLPQPGQVRFYDRGRAFGPDDPHVLDGVIAIRFLPNGQTSLTQNQLYFMTLFLDEGVPFDPGNSQFLTLSVNPATGRTRIFEP